MIHLLFSFQHPGPYSSQNRNILFEKKYEFNTISPKMIMILKYQNQTTQFTAYVCLINQIPKDAHKVKEKESERCTISSHGKNSKFFVFLLFKVQSRELLSGAKTKISKKFRSEGANSIGGVAGFSARTQGFNKQRPP